MRKSFKTRLLSVAAGIVVAAMLLFAFASDATRVISHPEEKVAKSSSCTIDYSNAKDGYICIKHADNGRKTKVRISFGNKQDTYDIVCDDSYVVYPLKYGAGTYVVTLYGNVSGSKYAQEYACNVWANITDPMSCYLIPNQKCMYTRESAAVKKADELCAGLTDDMDKITAIYKFVSKNIHYDYLKAMNVQSGYLPDVDSTLSTGMGICYDFSSLMCCMLRSQGIPAQLCVGYLNGTQYHAWNKVYVNGAWKMLDATSASQGKSYKSSCYAEDAAY